MAELAEVPASGPSDAKGFWLARFFFLRFSSLVRLGARRPLMPEDLAPLRNSLSPELLYRRFAEDWHNAVVAAGEKQFDRGGLL